jgi:carboxypeptidase family protein
MRPALAAASLLTLTTGCVTINGKPYSSGTRFVAEIICQPQKSSENLHVVVKDSNGNPIPRAKVRVVQEPVGGIDSGLTDTEGAAAFTLGSDAWQVSVWFPGYYSGTSSAQIGAGQICVLTFYLRFNDRIDPGLFFCRLEDDAETAGP